VSVQAGIWNLNDEPIRREWLTGISSELERFGPDSEAIHTSGSIGMLYRAFHTTAESRFEQQPVISAAGRTYIWDGRLDNRDELLKQLGSAFAEPSTDADISAKAFDQWGTKCFGAFIGDWAFSVWDPGKEELILARDYLGIRPLFYHYRADRIAWCSQLLPLALRCAPLTLCNEYIADYLVMHPDARLTPYREIHAVPPGCFVRTTRKSCANHRHWNFQPHSKITYPKDSDYEQHFQHLFAQAVRCRLRSNSPILAELSGGLDSTSIVCMADHILKNDGSSTPRVDTFSFWDSEEPDDEDFRYVTQVEKQRGLPGHHARLRSTGDSLPFANFQFTAAPGFDGREEVKTAIRQLLEQTPYRVVLSGRGGDEANGQALDFRVQIADCISTFQFTKAAQLLKAWSIRARHPVMQLLGQSANLLLPARMRIGNRNQLKQSAPWVNHSFSVHHRIAPLLLTAAEGACRWLPSTRDAFQTINTLAREMSRLPPSDAEKRYPFLDQRLLEFLMSIPPEQVLRPGDRRSLMRRALSNLLPKEVLSRKGKSGTGRCVALTINKHWHTIQHLLDAPLSSRFGFIEADALRNAATSGRHGQLSQIVRLLRAIALELWLREAIARGVITAESEHRGSKHWSSRISEAHPARTS
jgi:asparagine synthase (glutamine-hydrolysing)